MFLFQQIDSVKQFKPNYYAKLPEAITENLNEMFELREYQINAFKNFLIYYENSSVRPNPTQVLFHMATGSGKTLIMAGLITYLYTKGYRNFLFFVNRSNIVKKTKENFLNSSSSKFLFKEKIIIDGVVVPVKEVLNFQFSDENAINICFTTIQSLHFDMTVTKENSITIDDFVNQKFIMISDEAHHINALTLGVNNKNVDSNIATWEATVNSIFQANNQNVLLEFTATCNLEHPLIRQKYEDKIVFDYPLKKFREDKYSKEIKTLRTDLPVIDKMIQACILSQYRLKVFQEHNLNIKPVILFKAKRSTPDKSGIEKTADEWMKEFVRVISNITERKIRDIASSTESKTMQAAFHYFKEKGVSLRALAQELKSEFNEEFCISANDDRDIEQNQLLLNSLEDADNLYRAVFAVNKLDEGWDVLNLFDIVRLYETRQSGGRRISQTTISEAQLIGRGARYCPFKISEDQDKYKRKYDSDINTNLRICEELYYHCQNDSRYIAELHKALQEIGLDIEQAVEIELKIKDKFKQEPLYKKGFVFINQKQKKNSLGLRSLPVSIINKRNYSKYGDTGGKEDVIFEGVAVDTPTEKVFTINTSIGEIAKLNYSLVHKAIRQHKLLQFNVLKRHFPDLGNMREFVFGDNFLNKIKIEIKSTHKDLPPIAYYNACVKVLKDIADNIRKESESFIGTINFLPKLFKNIFEDKIVLYTNPQGEGAGISQKDPRINQELRLDLGLEDWYVFNDNYGTTEEKKLIVYMKSYISQLKNKFNKVYLVRNERHLAIYSFETGDRFEPDYLLFLQKHHENEFEQIQIFVEPKGKHLIEHESWKENFLLDLKAKAIPITTITDNDNYHIWGFHFFNEEIRSAEFLSDLEKLL